MFDIKTWMEWEPDSADSWVHDHANIEHEQNNQLWELD